MDIKQNESTASRRTIDLALWNTSDGSPYTGTAPGAGEAKVKKAGASEANYAGTFTHVGNGHWEYLFHVGEVDTFGKLSLRINKSGVGADVYTNTVVAYDPYSATSLGLSNLDATVSSRSSLTEASLLDLPDGVETGLSLRQALRGIAAMLFGKVSGAGSGKEVFRSAVDTRDALTITNDTAGNRTSVTRNL